MSETHRITVDPKQHGGRFCIRGMRTRVKAVLDLLAAGSTVKKFQHYPYLEDGAITAVLEYPAQQTNHPVLRSAL